VAGPLTARLAAPVTYLVLAVLGHLPAFRSLSETTLCACKDGPQTDWYLAWTPYAVSQGRSPWFSQHLAAPEGVNLMWNTLLPLPGLLAWPVTATAGVLASHTLLAVLAFAGSATSMWWVAGRFAPWPWARFAPACSTASRRTSSPRDRPPEPLAGGAAAAVLLLAHELLVRQRRRAVVAGVPWDWSPSRS
jgi:hypothetical protein